MTSVTRSAIYMTVASIAVVFFSVAVKYFAFGTPHEELIYVAATAATLNVFPMLFGHKIGLGWGRSPWLLSGALASGAIWVFLLLSIILSNRGFESALSYLPTAVFSALATGFLVHLTVNNPDPEPSTKDEGTTNLRTKSLKVEQADSDGLIREVEVMVIPKREDVPLTLPFSNDRKERDDLLEKVNSLVSDIYNAKKDRFRETNPTPGEREIVEKSIDKEMEESLKRVKSFGNFTLNTILSNLEDTSDPSAYLYDLLEDTKYANDVDVREASAFKKVSYDLNSYKLRPLLDNLRTCHPVLAREDLSTLEGDDLEFARKLLSLSLHYATIAENRAGSRESYRKRTEFSSDLSDARRKIRRHTPYMTPAMADVVLNHPDKLEQVQEKLEERSLPIHEADGLISEIVNASTPLSDGAL